MGSELLNFTPPPLPAGERDSREGVAAPEGLGGVGGAGGPMVSCAAPKSFASMVAAVFESREPPHVEQNRPFEATCAPQEEQYMGGAILPLRAAAPRRAGSRSGNYEMRSTWTAVP